MQPAPLHRYTFGEYLELEEVSAVRHEFLNGEIYAMAGGTPEHAAMAASVVALLGPQLKGCRVYSSDLRVRVLATGLATHPDVTIICGPSERDPASASHVTNPTVLVEIMSRGTEEYDRGEKLEHYKQIPSLRTVLLFNYRMSLVEVWERAEAGWTAHTFGAGSIIALNTIGCSLPVDDVYVAARGA